MHVILNAIGYRPQHDGKILLLKTPHTYITEYGEMVFHSYLLGFKVLKGTMQALESEK